MPGIRIIGPVANPLDGVLGDARRLYRGNAVGLLLLSAALFLPAAGLIVLITARRWPGAWCDLADGLASFLLLAVVAARLPASRAGVTAPARPLQEPVVRPLLRAAGAAAILAAMAVATTNAASFLGGLEILIAVPAMYLAFMSILTVPVIIIEGAQLPAALRRSWRLIHGHGPRLLLELIKAYAALVAVTMVPLFVASDPSLPYPLRMRLLPIPLGIGYGPFAALALTLAYYRLASARDAAPLNLAPQPGG